MYAYVRYMDDPNNRCIVPASTIQDFDVHDVKDPAFHCYYVWWKPSNNASEGGYYPAQVLLVNSTRELLEKEINSRRIHTPKMPDKSEYPEYCEHATVENKKCEASNRTLAKEKQGKASATNRKALQEILTTTQKGKRKTPLMRLSSSDDADSSGEEEIVVKKSTLKAQDDKYDVVVKRCQKLQAENSKLWERNDTLQMALAASVLRVDETGNQAATSKTSATIVQLSETVVYASTNPNIMEDTCADAVTISDAAAKTKATSTMNATTIPSLESATIPSIENVTIPSKEGTSIPSQESAVCPRGAKVRSPKVATAARMCWDADFKPSVDCGTGQVDLGGIFIESKKWEGILQSAKTPSIFCKELAITMWKPEILKDKSVTGSKSNANKASTQKPGLTPLKVKAIHNALRYHMQTRGYSHIEMEAAGKKVNKCLNEKIQDIRKDCNKKLF